MEELEEIHNSMINGQRDQAYTQISKYGSVQFFSDYREYLEQLYSNKKAGDHYADAVQCYIARNDAD